MDETAIWNYAPLWQTYVPSHMNGYVKIPDKNHRDTLVTALVGSERRLPNVYIESKVQKEKKG